MRIPMTWLRFTRLSYAETHEFSQSRSITGIVLIVVVCLLAGYGSLSFHGKLKTCSAAYGPFETSQVKEGGEGCQGTTVSVGELVNRYSFTYVVAHGINQYRNETLHCQIQNRSATINLPSFASPQFMWGYTISCSRKKNCCPKEIEKSNEAGILCSCDQNLTLHIQDFRVVDKASDLINITVSTPTLVNYSVLSNYSTLTNSISGITKRTCPDGTPTTVLRFDDTSYSAFNSSKMCATFDPKKKLEDPLSISIQRIRSSVDAGIGFDLQGFKVGGLDYVCYSCTHDLGQLLIDLVVAIAAVGSVAYSLVLWLLKVTQRQEPSTPTLEHGRRGPLVGNID